MVTRVLILKEKNDAGNPLTDYSSIGEEVYELSELYQIVKERQVDLILVASGRNDLKFPVASRIRGYDGLTEIWKLVDESGSSEFEPGSYFDGVISTDIGVKNIQTKVNQILKSKDLLKSFGIVGRSQKMKLVAETIERIAPTDVSVLIVGPSGAGKELIARAIHNNSNRSSNTYVTINCGAIAEGLLESELFGHEKGAFTGSVSKREGLFHKANNGTILLDEIGETKAEMQVKLLRVLEDGTYYPVGSSEPRYSNVRIISATNRDLSEAIAEKIFREDLYYRLSVVKIILPPLYERKSDIEPLLQFFWRDQNIDYTDSALEMLTSYDWPGNVRQLKNFTDRMAAFKQKGLVDASDVESFIDEQYTYVKNLPVSTGKTSEQAGQELIYHAILSLGNEVKMLRDLIMANLPDNEVHDSSASAEAVIKGMTVEEVEKLMIRHVLAETQGNRKEAAKKLGIGERTLYRKLKKYNLS